MVETVLCVHCGAQTKHPVTKMIEGRVLNFCCGGCIQVYELMRDEGQNSKETPAQFQTEQVNSVDRRNEGTFHLKTITLSIAGMTCANCVAHVEGSLLSVPGVINVNVILATERATVEITPGAVTIADLKHAVKDAGYEVLDVFDSGEA